MFRMAFLLVAMMPFMGALWLLTLIGQFQSMGPTSVVAAIAYTIAIVFAYYGVLDRLRPRTDFTRVKLRLGQGGGEVLSVIPFGVQLGGRSGPDYRLYRGRVREADGTEDNHTIAVEATMFGGGVILDQRHKHRSMVDLADGASPLSRPMTGMFGEETRESWRSRD